MNRFNDKAIVASWKINAKPWVSAVRGGEVESRLLVTNQAIIEAILKRQPTSVLDVGCGEGWLVRELEGCGVSTLGIDATAELIDAAQQKKIGRFMEIAYENLTYNTIKEKFDILVCNFSLLGKESVTGFFKQAPLLLKEGGALIVQTIHPELACGDEKYADGWREGSWAGFSHQFSDPAPWYFRTMASWKVLFTNNRLEIDEILEPVNPKTQVPASVLFVGLKIEEV